MELNNKPTTNEDYEQSIDIGQIKQNTTEVVSVKRWLGTLALLIIPIANIVLLFIWAFDKETNKNKSNFAKAYLIFLAIVIGFYIIIFVLFIGAMVSTIHVHPDNYRILTSHN